MHTKLSLFCLYVTSRTPKPVPRHNSSQFTITWRRLWWSHTPNSIQVLCVTPTLYMVLSVTCLLYSLCLQLHQSWSDLSLLDSSTTVLAVWNPPGLSSASGSVPRMTMSIMYYWGSCCLCLHVWAHQSGHCQFKVYTASIFKPEKILCVTDRIFVTFYCVGEVGISHKSQMAH